MEVNSYKQQFREINKKFNVETTTSAEISSSNNNVERHNLSLAEAMLKPIKDIKCAPDVALAQTLSTINVLQNHVDFSPNQLVFGCNIYTPSVMTDQPSVLTLVISSIIRDNLNVIHNAKKNYMAAKASGKIQKALRHKIRSYVYIYYDNGD